MSCAIAGPGVRRNLSRVALPCAGSEWPPYDPSYIEGKYQDYWSGERAFPLDPECPRPERLPRPAGGTADGGRRFCMLLPPPNVTGSLHLGHALTVTIQDAICRFHRLSQGSTSVRWIGGFDHAGIASQSLVEKRLLTEKGLTKHDVGRDGLVGMIKEFAQTNRRDIRAQMRRMGASLDENLEYFTLDKSHSDFVRRAFIRLNQEGLIYRANRMINWVPSLQTVISDIEVNHKEFTKKTGLTVPQARKPVYFGVIYEVSYPLLGTRDDKHIVVATTRPETMLGDQAIAVHSTDERYKDFVGMHVKHPLLERTIPVIADDQLVDPNKGTGAVKITPGHDMNDYLTGQRHGLAAQHIFDPDGKISSGIGSSEFSGINRFDARRAILDRLRLQGNLRAERDFPMKVALCSRSNDVVEPRLMPQWFVKVQGLLKEQAVKQVQEGAVQIQPKSMVSEYLRWMHEAQDWCVSRQLWWGHRLPVYHPTGNKKVHVVASTAEEARSLLGADVEQSSDVLDTWFSSALIPLSVAGQLKSSGDPEKCYPSSVLETASDILYFWVARMIMLCTHLSETRTPPFEKVWLHGVILDRHGKKMSKSARNGVDPMDLIEMRPSKEKSPFPSGIGADAMRWGLVKNLRTHGSKLEPSGFLSSRKLMNKLWNVAKVVLDPERLRRSAPSLEETELRFSRGTSWPLTERYMISKLHKCTLLVQNALENFTDVNLAIEALERLVVRDFSSVYLEAYKPRRLTGGVEHPDHLMLFPVVYFKHILILTHPFIPFVTQELYNKMRCWISVGGGYPKEQRDYSILAHEKLQKGFVQFSEDETRFSRLLHLVETARRIRDASNRAFPEKQILRQKAVIVISEEGARSHRLDDIQRSILECTREDVCGGLLKWCASIRTLHSDEEFPGELWGRVDVPGEPGISVGVYSVNSGNA